VAINGVKSDESRHKKDKRGKSSKPGAFAGVNSGELTNDKGQGKERGRAEMW